MSPHGHAATHFTDIRLNFPGSELTLGQQVAHHRLKMADQLLDNGEVSATDADAARMFTWASESYSVQSSRAVAWTGQPRAGAVQ